MRKEKGIVIVTINVLVTLSVEQITVLVLSTQVLEIAVRNLHQVSTTTTITTTTTTFPEGQMIEANFDLRNPIFLPLIDLCKDYLNCSSPWFTYVMNLHVEILLKSRFHCTIYKSPQNSPAHLGFFLVCHLDFFQVYAINLTFFLWRPKKNPGLQDLEFS